MTYEMGVLRVTGIRLATLDASREENAARAALAEDKPFDAPECRAVAVVDGDVCGGRESIGARARITIV